MCDTVTVMSKPKGAHMRVVRCVWVPSARNLCVLMPASYIGCMYFGDSVVVCMGQRQPNKIRNINNVNEQRQPPFRGNYVLSCASAIGWNVESSPKWMHSTSKHYNYNNLAFGMKMSLCSIPCRICVRVVSLKRINVNESDKASVRCNVICVIFTLN